MQKTMQAFGGVLIALLFLALPATLAHHGFAPFFDSESIITMTGTVTEVLWVNPHVYLHMDVIADGKAEEWTVELGSMNNLTRAGWTPERLKPGDPITITGWRGKPARNPYLGAAIDASSGLPRLAKLREAQFRDGSKYPVSAQ